MYDEKAKERSIRYLKDKREKLTLNLPLGSKERYKSHAERKGKSLTGLIIELIEKDIERGVKNNAIEEKIDELNQNIQLSKNNNGLILGDTVHSQTVLKKKFHNWYTIMNDYDIFQGMVILCSFFGISDHKELILFLLQ